MIKHNRDGKVEFVGSTCYIRNESVQVMSDIWEYVPTAHSIDENGRMATTYLWGDRWAGGEDKKPSHEVLVDVTEESYQRFWQYVKTSTMEKLWAEAESKSLVPHVKGRTVRVSRGRTHKDVVGKVVVVMEATYHAGYRSSNEYKLGIATSDRKIKVMRNGREFENYADVVWVWARNCEVVNPVVPAIESFAEEATKTADFRLEAVRNSAKHGCYDSYGFARAA